MSLPSRGLRIAALSLDVYGTLIDLGAISPVVLSGIFSLAGKAEAASGSRLWDEVSADVFHQFRQLERSDRPAGDGFLSVRQMFKEAYARALPRHGLGAVSPAEAADILIRAHASASLYGDVIDFLRGIPEGLEMCVSSDADQDFLDLALSNSGLDLYVSKRVCSGDVRAYKAEPSGAFFRAVLAALGCRAEEVAHVGDGESDVVGAKRAGLVAVWLRRAERQWRRRDVRPDFTVNNLAGLAALLEGSRARRAAVGEPLAG